MDSSSHGLVNIDLFGLVLSHLQAQAECKKRRACVKGTKQVGPARCKLHREPHVTLKHGATMMQHDGSTHSYCLTYPLLLTGKWAASICVRSLVLQLFLSVLFFFSFIHLLFLKISNLLLFAGRWAASVCVRSLGLRLLRVVGSRGTGR